MIFTTHFPGNGSHLYHPKKIAVIFLGDGRHEIVLPTLNWYNGMMWSKKKHIRSENSHFCSVTSSTLTWQRTNICTLLSGNLLRSYWKLPFIVDIPIKNGDFPSLCLFTRGYSVFLLHNCCYMLLHNSELVSTFFSWWNAVEAFIGVICETIVKVVSLVTVTS